MIKKIICGMTAPSAGGARVAGIREKGPVAAAPSAVSRAAAAACNVATGTGKGTGGVCAAGGIEKPDHGRDLRGSNGRGRGLLDLRILQDGCRYGHGPARREVG